MKFVHVLICAALIAFFFGMLHGLNASPIRQPQSYYTTFNPPVNHKTTAHDLKPTESLKPCSEVNTMPCEVSPPNPLKESLDAKEEASGRFVKGEQVTCIYPGVFYHEACSKDQCMVDDAEFIKNVAVECKVIQASEVYNGDTQQLKVNCLKDLETKWSSKPGATMVKGHKLNLVERWFFSDDCYHFVQSH